MPAHAGMQTSEAAAAPPAVPPGVMRLRRQPARGASRAGLGRFATLLCLALCALALAACGSAHPRTSRPAGRTPSSPDRALAAGARHAPGPAAPPATPAERALGLPSVRPASPLPGYLLIADRDNNRLLLVAPDKRVVWRFPRRGDLGRKQSFREPDDAFFGSGYRELSVNEEFNDQIAIVSLRARRIVWTYGRAGIAGAARGELASPDDAYELANGDVLVADIRNCRVLRISRAHRIVQELGAAGRCVHDPPQSLSAPNGATPLRDGGVLVTEIGGWVDRIDAQGRVVFSIRTPTRYPSDAQLLPNGDVLVAAFETPGRIYELTPSGRVVWRYGPPSGPGALDRPSLAVPLPNGLIAVTDDWHHRVVIIDPRTRRIVWQYGHDGVPGSGPGYLSKPDGLDLLPAPPQRARHSSGRSR